MLQLSFAGTLGADPELRTTGNGNQVTEFRVAVNGYDFSKKEKTTTWLKVTIWGKRGEQLSSLLSKGSRVAGSGTLQVQEYTTRDGEKRTALAVTVNDLTFQGGGSDAPRQPAKGKSSKAASGQESFPDTDDDDLPF